MLCLHLLHRWKSCRLDVGRDKDSMPESRSRPQTSRIAYNVRLYACLIGAESYIYLPKDLTSRAIPTKDGRW